MDVVAVALDPQWAAVDRFFADGTPPGVFLGDSGQAEALGVHTLPVTLLVDAEGRIRLRFDGARDWTSTAFASAWMTDVGIE